MFYPDAYWAIPANFESRLPVALLKGDARRRDCDELRIAARPIAQAPPCGRVLSHWENRIAAVETDMRGRRPSARTVADAFDRND